MPPIEQVPRSNTGLQVWPGFVGRLAAALCLSMAIQVSASGAVNSPPGELIDELARKARLIVRIHVQNALVTERSGNYLSYQVSARVTKLYRGEKQREAVINYRSLAEEGTEDFSYTDRIVFLKRGRTASSQWNALEFGQFRYDKALERRIQKRLNRSNRPSVHP